MMAYNGPVEESNIAARKDGFEGGKRTCASALPAPADCIEEHVNSPPCAYRSVPCIPGPRL